MTGLGMFLTLLITVVWANPAGFGRWLRKVWDGFGPVSVNKHFHVDAEIIAIIREALRSEGERGSPVNSVKGGEKHG